MRRWSARTDKGRRAFALGAAPRGAAARGAVNRIGNRAASRTGGGAAAAGAAAGAEGGVPSGLSGPAGLRADSSAPEDTAATIDSIVTVAHRLYVAGSPAWTLVSTRALALGPESRWALGALSPRFWRTLPADALTALSSHAPSLEHAGGDPGDRHLAALPLSESGRLVGGVLVRLPAGVRESRQVSARLEDPAVRERLRTELRFEAARHELAELRAFRDAVGQALPYGALVIDPLGRVVHLGGRTEEILGISAEDALGADCARVLRPVGFADRHPLLEALRGRGAPIEFYVARADGTEIPVSLLTAPLGGRGTARGRQERRGLVAFLRDLSEERVLAESTSQRDRLMALGELSAGVAHEIRNPLTGIANCAQVLREGRLAEPQRERFLDLILDEAARLDRIVEGLLSYARPNRPELRESDVLDSIRRILDLQGTALTEAGIRSTLVVRGRIPRIYVDSGQIEQVLLNLVRNAQEAMPDGGELKLEVAVIRRLLHQRRTPGRRTTDRFRYAPEPPRVRFLQIRVSDTGRGIPKEHLSRIWNPFFTTRTRGTGLGLSLSLAIVREHGGTLAARSVENKGTTILLDLPIERRQGERRQDS